MRIAILWLVVMLTLPSYVLAFKIKSVDIDPDHPKVGDTVQFTAKTDDKAQKVEINFPAIPGPPVQMKDQKDGKKWQIKFKMSKAGKKDFTVTAYDKKGKKDTENKSVEVKPVETSKSEQPPMPGDKDKPRMHSFGPNKSTIKAGETVEIAYTVSDTGGSGLRQVELWKGTNKGKLDHYKTDSVKGNGPVSGKFTDSPSPGGTTYYYGIHVLDNKNNLTYDDGAKPVTVVSVPNKTEPLGDKDKPRIHSFGPNKPTIKAGETVEIAYTVSDTGGSGLRQVELWKGISKGQLVHDKTASVKGNGPVSGKFTDSPSPAGTTYYYGIHVVDNKDNKTYDNGALPVEVILQSSNTGNIKIISVDGNTNIVGQPDWAAQTSKSNKTRGCFAVDYVNNINLVITGKGFGAKQGKGSISFSDNNIKVSKVILWSDNKIIVAPKTTTVNYTYNKNIVLSVHTDDGKSESSIIPLVGTIATRPYGQCTWYVANKRLSMGFKTIPPSAYTKQNQINTKYIPQRGDCLEYGSKHVGIIISDVKKEIVNGEVKYSFIVGEMNAGLDEQESTFSAQFVIDIKNNYPKKEIGSNAGSKYIATYYYRGQ